MSHELEQPDVAPPWWLAARWLDSLGQAGTAAVRRLLQWSGVSKGKAELRMSREWLAEHERRSNSRYDGI